MARPKEGGLCHQGAIQPRSDVLRRAAIRLIPFLATLYFISYLDRVNISFAALQMNSAIGLSPTEYGIGAGIFFLGYLAFQIPSNILLLKFGARRWLAVIIFTWGAASMSLSIIGNAEQFYLARLALGAAEAGFFPGLVLYLTYWFPAHYRGRIMAGLLLSVPLATVVGAPISNAILNSFDGYWNWDGWRWLFFIESAPAMLAAFFVWFLLPDGPDRVSWLTSEEKRWLADELHQGITPASADLTAFRALIDPRVILFSAVYFSMGLGLFGVGLWLPQIIRDSGASQSDAVLLTAVPYAVAALSMIVWARIADRNPVAPRNCWIPLLLSGAALSLLPLFPSLGVQMILLSIAAAGTLSAIGVFWTLPTASLPTKYAGIVIAAINTTGSLGGFFGPVAVGWLKEVTGSFGAGMAVLASGALISALLLMLPRARAIALQ